ncbi:hypothetical protein IGI57_002504 [Enterococcus sp. DIV0213j]|uniref:hypothetical protein n=1 Tax=Enterococcus sp. DIV0213j TaxID=2774649 RepID=UPI000352C621|nr:phosphocarrier protein HPr domain protein [Enterococcus faecalis 13-SD-W-01]
MVSMTIFWCVIGVIVAVLGAFLIRVSEEDKGSGSLIGTILLVVGILIAVAAQFNLYVNGSQEDLVRFMFWMNN